MSVVVIATIRPVPEHRAEVVAAYEDAVARVHEEDDGCELYALHEDDDKLVMIEKWTSREALAAHARGEALVELSARLDGKLLDRVDVQILQPHPAGTPEQGSL
jgi:quinol monooxygenase YgiN